MAHWDNRDAEHDAVRVLGVQLAGTGVVCPPGARSALSCDLLLKPFDAFRDRHLVHRCKVAHDDPGRSFVAPERLDGQCTVHRLVRHRAGTPLALLDLTEPAPLNLRMRSA